MTILFKIAKPKHWKVGTFRVLLEDIIEYLKAEEFRYDIRYPDSGEIIFVPQDVNEARRIVVSFSDQSASLWRFHCNRARRGK